MQALVDLGDASGCQAIKGPGEKIARGNHEAGWRPPEHREEEAANDKDLQKARYGQELHQRRQVGRKSQWGVSAIKAQEDQRAKFLGTIRPVNERGSYQI